MPICDARAGETLRTMVRRLRFAASAMTFPFAPAAGRASPRMCDLWLRRRPQRALARRLAIAAWLAAAARAAMAAGGLPAEPMAAASRAATKDELLACLVAEDEIGASRTRLTEQQAPFEKDRGRFRRAEEDLATQVRRHAPSTPAEIASYNRAIAARNTSAGKLNQAADALRNAQARLNERVAGHNAACGLLWVMPEVEAAARAMHRPAAASAPAAAAAPSGAAAD